MHDVASKLITGLVERWPTLDFDHSFALFGAATHDIGKVLVTEELAGPESAHEELGYALLVDNSINEELARFARTHGRGAAE